MRFSGFVLAALSGWLALGASSLPAAAEDSNAGYGMGGEFKTFDPIVEQYNRSGAQFRIEGHCQSACTLFLAIRNVCIDRAATLLFHAGHDRNRTVTSWATNHLLHAYNARLHAYLMANHFMDTLEFHSISGSEMIRRFGYRECPRS